MLTPAERTIATATRIHELGRPVQRRQEWEQWFRMHGIDFGDVVISYSYGGQATHVWVNDRERAVVYVSAEEWVRGGALRRVQLEARPFPFPAGPLLDPGDSQD
jgi:hypothetical protein